MTGTRSFSSPALKEAGKAVKWRLSYGLSDLKCIVSFHGHIWFWVIYGSIGRFDAWNLFSCMFEDFKTSRLKFEIVCV